MNRSDTISTFAAAFVVAQTKIEGATKDKTNPHFKAKYADLGSVMDACKTALNGEGISVIQAPAPSESGRLAIETILMHKSGEFVSGICEIPLSKNDPQGYGSAMTYARRYALAAMTGVCPEDDDGESAVGRGKQPQHRPNNAPPASPEPDPIIDDKAFRADLARIFKERKFTSEEMTTAMNEILTAYEVDGIGGLAADQRHQLLGAIRQGKADKYKQTAATAAGK